MSASGTDVCVKVPDHEQLAAAVLAVSKAVRAMLRDGRLKRHAIVALIKDYRPSLGKKDIELVLEALEHLEAYYLNPKKSAGGP